MKVISIYEAKTHLSKLVDMALAGQEIVIARRKSPLVSLQPVKASKAMRKVGALPGLVTSMPETFNDPLDDWADDPGFPDGTKRGSMLSRSSRK